jgi:hypothetical protein
MVAQNTSVNRSSPSLVVATSFHNVPAGLASVPQVVTPTRPPDLQILTISVRLAP